ncbi:hypothetical protein C1H46_029555 [Malus baccata]|uniref:Uncharacterized protein n=1 Tax=Malus baccata TaxID=106549 RepID=A0A540LF21_MALBA|nr:hypothetical protein C1H46_029555 [Malus baccata]
MGSWPSLLLCRFTYIWTCFLEYRVIKFVMIGKPVHIQLLSAPNAGRNASFRSVPSRPTYQTHPNEDMAATSSVHPAAHVNSDIFSKPAMVAFGTQMGHDGTGRNWTEQMFCVMFGLRRTEHVDCSVLRLVYSRANLPRNAIRALNRMVEFGIKPSVHDLDLFTHYVKSSKQLNCSSNSRGFTLFARYSQTQDLYSSRLQDVNFLVFRLMGTSKNVHFSLLLDLDTEVVIATAREPSTNATAVSANLVVDERQMNALFLDVIRVSESYGLKFP